MEQMSIWFILCGVFVFVGGLALMAKGLAGMIGKEVKKQLETKAK
jgi:Na+/phosphate symporter